MKNLTIIGIAICILGYLLGSVLFAPLFVSRIKKINLEQVSKDGNPGTANAFMQGGFLCGLLSLVCDIGKGFLPVYTFIQIAATQREIQKFAGILLVFVMIAPVIGHAYSIFHHFQGGKCIAVSFGVLIGFFPDLRPVLVLAFFYILFSILQIRPHAKRTTIAFLSTSILDIFLLKEKMIVIAMWLMSGIVIRKHLLQDKKALQEKQEMTC